MAPLHRLKTHLLGPDHAFTPSLLLASLTAGLLIGVMEIFIEISFAAMIFSGPLAPYLEPGIGFLLAGTIAISLIVALTSSFRGAIALPQDVSVVIVALMAAQIGASLQEELPIHVLLSGESLTAPASEAGFATVMAAIVVTTLLCGAFFLLMGAFNLGNLVRFIPYPVIGGFLAGTGWLLVEGGFGVLTKVPLTAFRLNELFHPDELAAWGPALAFGLVLLLAARRFRHHLVLPGLFVAGVVAFYLWLWLSGTTLAQARAGGLLLGPFPGGGLWQPLSAVDLNQVEWGLIAEHQPIHMGTLMLIGLVSLLLNASGIELSARRDVKLGTELKGAGLANLVAGFAGSPAGYQTLSLSVLGAKIAPNTRLIGLCVAGVTLAVLTLGNTVLGLFPRFIMGGVLLFLGLAFLVEWLVDGWRKLSKLDYVLVAAIMVVIGLYGVAPGVGAGLFAAMVLFTIRYSLNSPIYQSFSGADFHSTVDRPPAQQRALRQRGAQVHVARLQGFLFFGTANLLYNSVCKRLDDPHQPPLRHLVLDFERVTEMDSSTEVSFAKIAQQAAAKHFDVLLCGVPAKLRSKLAAVAEADGPVQLVENLDRAVQWCEDRILAEVQDARAPAGFDELLGEFFGDADQVARFKRYLARLEVEPGQEVVRQGTPAENIYFVERGELEVLLQVNGGKPLRLRTIMAGAMFGELAVFLDQTRSATVRAAGPCTLHRLSKAKLQEMWEGDSALAARFDAYLIKSLSQRLVDNNRVIEHLTK